MVPLGRYTVDPRIGDRLRRQGRCPQRPDMSVCRSLIFCFSSLLLGPGLVGAAAAVVGDPVRRCRESYWPGWGEGMVVMRIDRLNHSFFCG